MSARQQLFLFLLAAVLGLGGGLAVALWKYDPSSGPLAETLYTRTFPDTQGRDQPLAQWQGQVLVVNFWATWCPPCIREMPDLQKIADDYQSRDVTVVGIAIDNPQAVREFKTQYGLRMPILDGAAGGNQLAAELGNPSGALPFTVVIDRKGRIIWTRLGLIDPEELRRKLDAAS